MKAASPKTRTALIAGATGLVGQQCLRLLAHDDDVVEVRALVRHPLPPQLAGPRVRECRADFERLAAHPDWFDVDWVFCALGTTMRRAGSREAFRHLDYDYPLAVAKAALEGGASQFLLVSAAGADRHSHFFYSRVKGELEEALRSLGFPSLTIARPSLILGDRGEFSMRQEVAKSVAGLLPARWRPVHAAQVAAALTHAAHVPVFGTMILENSVLRTYPMPLAQMLHATQRQ